MKAVKLFLAAALAFAAATAPAAAQSPSASRAQDLANCAGAVAALADFDVITFPAGAYGEWQPVLARILDALNREPGVEGMTGRYAAGAARTYWLERPRAERERAAGECRTQFGEQEHG
jgi:hypothetical protein